MDTRLRQILELALRPETGEGESAAALAAARRLVAKQGLTSLLGKTSERVVYRDRTSAPSSSSEKTKNYNLTIPASFAHAMIERVLQDSHSLNLNFKLNSLNTKDNKLLSSTLMEYTVSGSAANIKQFDKVIDNYIEQINNKIKNDNSYTSSNTTSTPKQPSKSWFQRIFG
jgi:hypothetical protein